MSKLFFHHVTSAPPDPIFGLNAAFNADSRSSKINLSAGVYRNDQLITPILKSVKEAEKFLIEKEKSKEYLPLEGDSSFINKVGSLVFGEFFWTREKDRIAGMQTLGGTGALRIGADFLKHEVGDKIVISDPTWPNHQNIFTAAGLMVAHYPYYDLQKQSLNFDRTCQFLKNLSPGTIVVLQPCCHNPTGADWSIEEWKNLRTLFKDKGVLPFFDFAYQGFGKGIEKDAEVIRLFSGEGMEMLIACSQSKNFGLYSERVGALYILTDSAKSASNVISRLKTVCRSDYSNPPRHGSAIVAHILTTPLKETWEKEVEEMHKRIEKLRRLFVEELVRKSPVKDYRYLAERTGMFCFTGLDKEQVDRLRTEYAIYMTSDGRMNIAGLTDENLSTVVKALIEV